MVTVDYLIEKTRCFIGVHYWVQSRALHKVDICNPSFTPYLKISRNCPKCGAREKLLYCHGITPWFIWVCDTDTDLVLSEANIHNCAVGQLVLVKDVCLDLERDVVGKIAKMSDENAWVLLNGYMHTNANGYCAKWEKVKKIAMI